MSDDVIEAIEAGQRRADEARRKSGGKEIHGDFNGYVLDVGGVAKGKLSMDLVNGKVTFEWEDAGSAWPSTFKLRPPSGYTIPTTTVDHTFEHKSFTASASSYDVSSCQYELKYGGTTYGWMHYSTSGTTWYGVPAQLTVDGLIDAPELEFASNTTSGYVSAIQLYDSAL